MFTPDLVNDKALRAPSYRQWSESCNNFRELSVLHPESKDMCHCHPHHFLEIFKTPVNEPIGSYQIQHLNLVWVNVLINKIFYCTFNILQTMRQLPARPSCDNISHSPWD